MALRQTAGCPRVIRAKKFMCSPRNTGNIHFFFWSTGGLSQGCPDFQKVYVFKVYVPFSCPKKARIFNACRTPKILGKEGKKAQNRKEFLEKEKGKEIHKGKEKKIRAPPA